MSWISQQLGEAILTKDIERLKRTLVIGKNHVNTLIDNEISPLGIATSLKYGDMVVLLRASGANESEEFRNNFENAKWAKVSIFDAIETGDAKAVSELCKREKYLETKPFVDYDFNSPPPLFWAIKFVRPECLKILLKYDKARINKKFGVDIRGRGVFNFTPLEFALVHNIDHMKNIVKLLLRSGASDPKEDSELYTRLKKDEARPALEKIRAEIRAEETRGISELSVEQGLPEKVAAMRIAAYLGGRRTRHRKVSNNKTYKRKNM